MDWIISIWRLFGYVRLGDSLAVIYNHYESSRLCWRSSGGDWVTNNSATSVSKNPEGYFMIVNDYEQYAKISRELKEEFEMRILVSCANGSGTSLMMMRSVEKAMKN